MLEEKINKYEWWRNVIEALRGEVRWDANGAYSHEEKGQFLKDKTQKKKLLQSYIKSLIRFLSEHWQNKKI